MTVTGISVGIPSKVSVEQAGGVAVRQVMASTPKHPAKAFVPMLWTDLNIQQISDTLHFPSQSVFGKFFKRATGLSPREYREQAR